jgi:hypothetical protein
MPSRNDKSKLSSSLLLIPAIATLGVVGLQMMKGQRTPSPSLTEMASQASNSTVKINGGQAVDLKPATLTETTAENAQTPIPLQKDPFAFITQAKPELKKNIEEMDRYLQPLSAKAQIRNYVLATIVVDYRPEWHQFRTQIENDLQTLQDSDIDEIQALYNPEADPFVNQRLMEVVFKSSGSKERKTDFYTDSWKGSLESKRDSQAYTALSSSFIFLRQMQVADQTMASALQRLTPDIQGDAKSERLIRERPSFLSATDRHVSIWLGLIFLRERHTL